MKAVKIKMLKKLLIYRLLNVKINGNSNFGLFFRRFIYIYRLTFINPDPEANFQVFRIKIMFTYFDTPGSSFRRKFMKSTKYVNFSTLFWLINNTPILIVH